jgi:hypothetical protein
MRQRVLELLVCICLASILLFCLGFVAPVQFLVMIIAGWVIFMWRVVPQIELDLGALILSLGALAMFLVGLHWLLRWFAAAAQRTKDVAAPGIPVIAIDWKWSWTLAITVLTLLMFVAGISFVGMTHQFVWLATSEDPLMATSGNYAYRLAPLTMSLPNKDLCHLARPLIVRGGYCIVG